jgi:hypothetical protein
MKRRCAYRAVPLEIPATSLDSMCRANGTQLLVRHPLALSRAAIELDGAVELSLYNQRL